MTKQQQQPTRIHLQGYLPVACADASQNEKLWKRKAESTPYIIGQSRKIVAKLL